MTTTNGTGSGAGTGGAATTESATALAPIVPAPVAPTLDDTQPNKNKRREAPAPSAGERQYKKLRVSELLGITKDIPPPDEKKTLLTSSGEWTAAEAITKAMPKNQGVPMTILTGFLGAGKSTVLNYILKADHGLKIAVLINEFGVVDIDNQLVDTVGKGEEGEPIMLNNGCVCCTISSGFADAVRKTLEDADARGRIPDYFIVETTGLADPKPIVDSVRATELSEEIYIDQILTVVDASAWTDAHYDSDTAMSQIENADTVLLSKTDLCGSDRIDTVVESILAIRPSARILRSQRGYVPIAALFDLGVPMVTSRKKPIKSKDAVATNGADKNGHDHKHEEKKENGHDCKQDLKHEDGQSHDVKKEDDKKEDGLSQDNKKEDGRSHDDKKEDGKDHKHDHDHEQKNGHDHKHDHGHQHHHHGHDHGDGHVHDENCKHEYDHKNPARNHLEEEGFSSISFVTEFPLSMRRFKEDFMDNLPTGVFRAKGLLYFANAEDRYIFHWSGQRFQAEEQEWPEGVVKKNQLVVIGRKLDREAIHKMLEACIVKPGEESEEEEEEDYEDEGVNPGEPGYPDGYAGDEGEGEHQDENGETPGNTINQMETGHMQGQAIAAVQWNGQQQPAGYSSIPQGYTAPGVAMGAPIQTMAMPALAPIQTMPDAPHAGGMMPPIQMMAPPGGNVQAPMGSMAPPPSGNFQVPMGSMAPPMVSMSPAGVAMPPIGIANGGEGNGVRADVGVTPAANPVETSTEKPVQQ